MGVVSPNSIFHIIGSQGHFTCLILIPCVPIRSLVYLKPCVVMRDMLESPLYSGGPCNTMAGKLWFNPILGVYACMLGLLLFGLASVVSY